jgi:plastocyanin
MMKTVRERGTRRARIRIAVFVGTAALALGMIGATAWAVFQPIGSVDNSYTGGSGDPANPTFTMDQGDRPTFSDGGVAQHNVTARTNGPDGKALFLTPTLNGGQSATLDGSQYLTAGSYTFFCTIHPTEMQATLLVTGNGTPQARPSATAKLRTKTISKAVKKGLQVAVTANTQVNGATVTAKLGKATIGKTGASLAAGAQNVKLKLSKAGKSKLGKKSSAKVTVTVDIPFGFPATAKAKLK